MTKQEIANYYSRLSNGEIGRFTAFLSVVIDGLHTLGNKRY